MLKLVLKDFKEFAVEVEHTLLGWLQFGTHKDQYRVIE